MLKQSGIKRTSSILGAAVAAVLASHTARATVIYSNVFNGPSTSFLNGTVPGVENNSGGEIGAGVAWTGGVQAMDWKADGSVSNGTSNYSNAILPFTPNAGEVYELSGTLFESTNSNLWDAFGFQQGSTIITSSANGANRLIDAGGNGYAFLLHRGNDSASADQLFGGPITSNVANLQLGWAQQVAEDAEIYLDTTGSQWVATFYVRNDALPGDPFEQAFSYTYPAGALPIHFIAINETAGGAGKISNLQLQSVSTWNVDSDGDFTNASNWHGGAPNGVDAEADLLGVITSSRTLTMNSGVTLGTLRFNSSKATVNVITGDTTASTRSYTITGSGALTMQSSLSSGALINVDTGAEQINVPVTLASNTTINTGTGSSVSFGNSLSGTGSLTLSGGGTVSVQPTNSYQGGTILNGGTLAGFTSLATLGASNSLTFNGGLIQYAPGVTSDFTALGLNVSVLAGGAGIDTNGNNVTFANPFASGSTGPFTKAGAGTLTLNAINTYQGATNITGGTLRVGVSGAVPSGTAMTIGTSATLDLNGFSRSLGSLAGAGTVIGTANLTVGTNNTNTTFTGSLNNVGSLSKVGTGTLTLSGTDSYGGGTTINQGAILFNAGSIPSAGTILINGAGALDIPSTGTVTAELPSVDSASTGSVALTATTSTESINFAGYNNLMLGAAGTVTYTGTITPANSIYRLGGGGGTLTLSSAGALSGSNSLIVGATGATGTVVLSAANTYGGGTTINSGILRFSALNNLGTGSIAINGGTLQYATGNTADISTDTITVGSSGGIIDTNGNNITLANSIGNGGTGVLTKTGAGTLTLQGANTYSGGTNVIGGTLNITSLSNLGTGTNLTLNGGTLQYAVGSTTDISADTVTIGSSGGTIDTNGNNVTFANGIGNGGSGALTKVGTGMLTLGANNTYTGGTNINAGSLAFTPGSVPASKTITINAAGTLDLGGAFPTATSALTSGKITASSAGTLALAGNSSENINMTGYNSLVLGAAANATYTGVLTPAANQYRLGGGGATLTLPNANELTGMGNGLTVGANNSGASGTVVLNSANSYGGTTTIVAGGILNFAALADLGTGASISISGGTLQYGAGNTSDVTTKHLFFFSGGGTIDTNGNNVTFNNSFGSSGTFTKTGAGTLTLNTPSVLTSTTQVSGGTLMVGNTLSLQNASLNYNSLGGSVGFASNVIAATLGSIAGNQNLDLDNATSQPVALSVDNNGASTTYSGNFTGGGSLVKVGSGTLTLSGHSTYSGATTLSQGTTTEAFGTTGSTNILPATQLNFAGGTLTLTASGTSAASQSFSGTAIQQRSSTIADTFTTAGANVALGAITRNAGATVNLSTVPTAGAITTTTANSTFAGGQGTILGGYFIAAGNTWAVSAGTGTTAGAITGLASTGYATTFTSGADVDAPAGSVEPGTMTVNSLRFSIAGTHTIGSIGDGNTLTVANGGILINSTSGAVTLDIDNLTSGNGQDLVFWNQGTAVATVASAIEDNGSISIGLTQASGTVNLQNENSYTGPTTINGGTLQFFDNGSLGNGGAINFAGGTLQYNGSADDISGRTITMGFGDGTINTNGQNVNFSNSIGNQGVGNFSKAGTGTLTLNGATYTGSTTVSAGALELASGTMSSTVYSVASGASLNIDNGASIPTNSDVTVTGTLTVANSSLSLNTLSGAGALNLNNATNLIITNGSSLATLNDTSVFSGVIADNNTGAAITVNGGQLTLSGTANTYTGPMTINSGAELTFSALGSLGNGGTINFAGGTLQYAAGNTADISGRPINIGSAGAIIDTNGNNVAFAHGIGNGGSGSLTKIGQGTLTLSVAASDSYTGATNVSGGKLIFGQSASVSALNVDNGATAALAANTVLTTSNLSLNSTGTLDISSGELSVPYTGSSPAAAIRNDIAAGYDKGHWDQPGLTSSLLSTSAALAVGYEDTGSRIIAKATWYGDTNLDGVVNNADLLNINPHGTTWQTGDFNYDGVVNADDYALFQLGNALQNGAITPAVPEPVSVSMLALGLGAGLLRRQRRE
ncbi:MAG TPA: autotransporter-associated beta strand repeat-containing protein [Tepidisphaeraceae bacterium]|jgi:autotransporter-associated beta strand protein